VVRRLSVCPTADFPAPGVTRRGKGFEPSEEMAVDVQEVKKLDAYLKKLFGNPHIRVVPRPKKDDSAEVYVGEEFIGVLFVDDEDEERSYNFQMAILGTDLD
jgi:hypothetical protein